MRTRNNLHTLLPGVTGWAQVNGRDSLTIEDKVLFDKFYLNNKSLRLDLKILLLSISKVLSADNVNV